MLYSSAYLRERNGRGYIGVLSYKDENGKWRKKEKAIKASGKREAKRELEEWRDAMEAEAAKAALYMPSGNVAQYVSRYIDTLEASGSVERSTITSYRTSFTHIERGVGSFKLEELVSESAQAWVNAMNQDGYAASTIRKAFNLLKAAMNCAEDAGCIARNPLGAVKLPKITKKEPNALNPAQRARLVSFLDAAYPSAENLGIRIALFTGMREGEVCGLQWKNVDLKTRTIGVRTTIGRDGGKTYVKEPKTGGSRRDIPITESLEASLRQRRSEMAERCLESGVPFTGELYVLGKLDGSYMAPHTLWMAWRAISKNLGLMGTQGEIATFHDLRHTFATTAISEGADVKSTSSMLGHANAAMTLNIYASADPDAKRRAAEAVSRAMEREHESAPIIQLMTGTDGE